MQVGCQQPLPQTPLLSATFDNFGQTSPLLEDRPSSPMLVDSPLAAQLPRTPVGEVPATPVVEVLATPLVYEHSFERRQQSHHSSRNTTVLDSRSEMPGLPGTPLE
eukprot:3152004-Amphidinium_carterae.1